MKDLYCVSITTNNNDDDSRTKFERFCQIEGIAGTALEWYLKESNTIYDESEAFLIKIYIGSLNYFDAKRLLERECAVLTDIEHIRENAMQIFSDIELKEIKSNILYEIALIYDSCNNDKSNAVKYFKESALLGNKYSM